MGNWHWFNKLLSDTCDVAFLLHLECPDEIMIERLLLRGQTSGRVDDNIEVIKARFRTEEQETKPIIEQFRAAGKIRSVNANRSIEEVFADVSLHFDVLN
jgi:UMP-CMP kinase